MNNYNLKPFQQVLVRADKESEWSCDLYSHYNENLKLHYCVGSMFGHCIPYEGNEELLGTTNAPQPKRWRAERGEPYWFVNTNITTKQEDDLCYELDDARFNIGNYFRTKEEAQAMADNSKQY